MLYNKAAVIVETRLLPNLVSIIDQHMRYLDPTWKLIIYGTDENKQTLINHFPNADFYSLGQTSAYSIPQYNALLTSKEFWQSIPYEKILIFQSDSMLLREGIEQFLEYDYCGAPWKWQLHGGNGGLSIRTKSIMLEIIKQWRFDKATCGNEDVYFSNRIESAGGRLAPREVCEKFACEAIFKLGTLGYHAIEKWLTAEQCNQIKSQYK
jgi:hypothetical protein